jgi:hypothetical protein
MQLVSPKINQSAIGSRGRRSRDGLRRRILGSRTEDE